jgi:CheY-like chemotaxis protein
MSQPGKRVLCAERNADICHLIFSLLSHAGYEVVKAGSARECLNAALAGGFDLYVLGDTYADDDGLELCRRLRELTPSTPILFLSPHATEGDEGRAEEPGAARHVLNPEDIFAVIETVNSLLAPRAADKS